MALRDTTILFAEDNQPLRTRLARVLEKNGYEIIVAEDGLEALEKAKQHEGDIHLLVSNIEMPGITGIELAKRLRSDRPHMGVLLISGMPDGMMVLDDGWHFLPKPFLPGLLVDRIETIIDDWESRTTLNAPSGQVRRGGSLGEPELGDAIEPDETSGRLDAGQD
jgi:DNA-binding response OmpR family regulator